jgi:GNAT superfamily N-acetyltransferase
MGVTIRPANDADIEACGRIAYEGFRAVNERHGFPPAFASIEAATRRVGALIRHPSVFGVVAESSGGRIAGFNFLSERDPVRAVGPIVVDPAAQGQGLGRRLMEAVLERARGAHGVRLLQDTFNMQSLSLYAALGFDAREVFVAMAGMPTSAIPAEWQVRLLTEAELPSCEALHRRVHGHPRTNELRDSVAAGSAVVALRGGHIRAYMAVPTYWIANHGVAETNADMQALILGAARIAAAPVSFLLPIRNAALFRWCSAAGIRATKPMTLMTIGEYREPAGSYFPSVLY